MAVDKTDSDKFIFFINNFNISSLFGVKDTLLSYNHSGLYLWTSRPGAVEGLGRMHQLLAVTTGTPNDVCLLWPNSDLHIYVWQAHFGAQVNSIVFCCDERKYFRSSRPRCIKLGGETDSAIRWRTRTGVTSPRGIRNRGSFLWRTFPKTFVENALYLLWIRVL